MRAVRALVAGLGLAGLALATGGCGISAEGAPRALQLSESPSPDAAQSSPIGDFAVTIFLIRTGNLLEGVPRPVDSPDATVETVLAELVKEPTDEEREAGYFTQVRSATLLGEVTNGIATIQVSDLPDAADVITLAEGQIVLSLIPLLPEVTAVQFVDEAEQPLNPAPSGQVIQRPLTTADFESLLAPERSFTDLDGPD